MTFLAPFWIVAAIGASAVVAGLHLISWQLPKAVPLPTARFVPDEPARRAARTIRPSDLALLALRIGILMAAGIALARPVFRPAPSGTASVIVVERAADSAVVRERLATIPRGNRSVFVVFDTAASVVADERAAIAALDTTSVPSLTVALLAGIREAKLLASDFERVDITLLSTFAVQSFDAATSNVRALWPDSIRVETLPIAPAMSRPGIVDVLSDGDDPVAAGIRLAQANGLIHGSARVHRNAQGQEASGFVSEGGAVVHWPRRDSVDDVRVDGVHAKGATAIGHFVRSALSDSGRVIARWVDGSPAAIEQHAGAGCLRTVGFDIPDAGDFAITPAFQRLAGALLGPCGTAPALQAAADSLVAAIASRPDRPIAVAGADTLDAPNRIATAFMMLAILLSVAEFLVRRKSPIRVAEAA